ncbi:MAG: TolC family protein [Parachlamydiales bacterium]|jgi:cobalt-zinc-cadmium efflux system outer membrane protein
MRFLIPISLLVLGSLLPSPVLAYNIEAAWQRICENSPELAIDYYEVEARNGGAYQVSLYPNPELGVEADNLVGSRKDCIGDMEFGAVVTQPIVTGGKICKRIAAANSAVIEAEWDYEMTKANLRERLEKAFISIAILQEKYKDSQRSFQLAQTAYQSSQHLATQGKITLLQTKKAGITLRHEEMHSNKLALELEQARLNLALLWNGCEVDFDIINYPISCITPPPCIDNLCAYISNYPEIAKSLALVELARNSYEAELAERYPDFAVTAGYKNYWNCNGHALVLALSVPLPVFDRNQGNICRMQALIQKAEYNSVLIRNQNFAVLQIEHKRALNAYNRALSIQNGLLKEIEESLHITMEAFNEGKITQLELIDTQKTYTECKSDYLDALLEYHFSMITISKLTGANACKLP